MLEIYYVERAERPWDMSNVAKAEAQKARDKARAAALYDRLADMKPADWSFNEWTDKAGVNSSFFTNMKKGSAPSVFNLEAILRPLDLTLSEFFGANNPARMTLANEEVLWPVLGGMLGEALGREPTESQLRVIASALPRVLELVAKLPAIHDSPDALREVGRSAIDPALAARNAA